MLKSGHRVVSVTGKESQKQFDEFLGNRVGTIRLQPDGWFFTLPYIDFADKIYDFKFKPSDVVVMTYPKCGTTWMQEIVWTLLNNLNLDNPKGSLSVNVRCPCIEMDFLFKNLPDIDFSENGELVKEFMKKCPGKNLEDGILLQMAEMAEDPRTIKTHHPFSLLSPLLLETTKVIYVVRDPKDVAVSYYYHSKLLKLHNFVGNMNDFVNHFINDTLVFGPFWPHIKEAWDRRDHPNLLFCYYEDIKANPKAEIERIKNFLNVNCTDEQINNIVDYTSFNSMKKRDNLFSGEDLDLFLNKASLNEHGGFFRKGESGDWKKNLTEEQKELINKWTKQNTELFEGNFKYKE